MSVHKIILARNLLRQSQTQTRFLVQFSVLQGTGDTSSTDHTGVQYHNRDCDPTVNPALHVRNGFLHFHFRELT